MTDKEPKQRDVEISDVVDQFLIVATQATQAVYTEPEREKVYESFHGLDIVEQPGARAMLEELHQGLVEKVRSWKGVVPGTAPAAPAKTETPKVEADTDASLDALRNLK